MMSNIPIGENSPKIVNAIVEISQATHNKYEYDEKLDIIKLDRVLYSPIIRLIMVLFLRPVPKMVII